MAASITVERVFRITRSDAESAEYAARYPYFCRNDVILVNAMRTHGGRSERTQYWLTVARDGTLKGNAFPHIGPADLAWAQEEAARLLAAVEQFPSLRNMLR